MDMKERFRYAINAGLIATGESVVNKPAYDFFNGYNSAAAICMDAVAKKINDLHSLIKPGYDFSESEKLLLFELKVLMTEMDDGLQAFSANSSPYDIIHFEQR